MYIIYQLNLKNIYSELIPVYFLFDLIFESLILHIFRKIIIIIRRSGMFHVPGFIDARYFG